MRAKLQILTWALGLLAFAHPELIPPALGTLGVIAAAVFAVAGWVLANLSLAFTAGAVVLLTYAFPNAVRRPLRWFSRALVDSVTAVLPRTV